LRKSGQGILFLHEPLSFTGAWEIANGVVEVQPGATTGSGPVAVTRTPTLAGEDVGVLRGRGTVGGDAAVGGEIDRLAGLIDESEIDAVGVVAVRAGRLEAALGEEPSHPRGGIARAAIIRRQIAHFDFAGRHGRILGCGGDIIAAPCVTVCQGGADAA
jgi:hypothetical protein